MSFVPFAIFGQNNQSEPVPSPTPTETPSPTSTNTPTPTSTPTPTPTPTVANTTIQFVYSMNLTQQSSRVSTISNYKFECYINNATPVAITCSEAITGTEPYSFTSTPVVANNLNGLLNSINISRSICRPSGLNFTINNRLFKVFKNNVEQTSGTAGGSTTPQGCPTVVTSTYSPAGEFTVSAGDAIRIEWSDTN